MARTQEQDAVLTEMADAQLRINEFKKFADTRQARIAAAQATYETENAAARAEEKASQDTFDGS